MLLLSCSLLLAPASGCGGGVQRGREDGGGGCGAEDASRGSARGGRLWERMASWPRQGGVRLRTCYMSLRL